MSNLSRITAFFEERRSLFPKKFKPGRGRSPLRQAQIDRIRAFKAILKEHEATPLVTTLDNFRLDRDPNKEIQVWEYIAWVYQLELAARPNADATERALVYKAIFACSFSPKMNDVLSIVPAAKGLKNLDRLVVCYAIQ